MTRALLHALPLAFEDRLNSQLHNLARGFQGRRSRLEPGEMAIFLAAVVAIVVGLWLLAYFIERREGRTHFDSSLGLFLRLGKEHGLKWREIWLLWRVARRQQLKEPARLFLEPERFDPQKLTPRFGNRVEALQGIARRLFLDWQDAGGRQPTIAGEKPREASQDARTPLPRVAFPVIEGPSLDVPPWTREPSAG